MQVGNLGCLEEWKGPGVGTHGHSTLYFPMSRTEFLQSGDQGLLFIALPLQHSKLLILSSDFCTNPSSSLSVPCDQTEQWVSAWLLPMSPLSARVHQPWHSAIPAALRVVCQSQPWLAGHPQCLQPPQPLSAVWKMGVVAMPTGFWQHLLPSLGSKSAQSVVLSGQGFHCPPSSLPAQPCHCNLSHVSGVC